MDEWRDFGMAAAEAKGKRKVGSSRPSTNFQWKDVMSECLLQFLAELVRSGTRCNRNAAGAKHIATLFSCPCQELNVKNHVRTWKNKWQTILRLKNLSGVSWNEEQKVIVMGEEEYAIYARAHSSEKKYINRPIEYYNELYAIFGDSVATGRYSRSDLDSFDDCPSMGWEDEAYELEDEEGYNPEDPSGAQNTTGETKRSRGSSYMSVSAAPAGRGRKGAGTSGGAASGRRRAPTVGQSLQVLASSLAGISSVVVEGKLEGKATQLSVHDKLKQLVGQSYGGYTFTLDHVSFALDYLAEFPRKASGFDVRDDESQVIWLYQFLARQGYLF